MKRKLRNYQEKLLEDLRDPELATHYLNEALASGDYHLFLLALKNVQEAQGVTKFAKKTNPNLSSIISLLSAVGFSLTVQPNKNR